MRIIKSGAIKLPDIQQFKCQTCGCVYELDLCYEEDSNCQTDLNVVMTQAGEFIEIQGTAEDKPFNRVQCNAMLEMAEKGIQELVKKQQQALGW